MAVPRGLYRGNEGKGRGIKSAFGEDSPNVNPELAQIRVRYVRVRGNPTLWGHLMSTTNERY